MWEAGGRVEEAEKEEDEGNRGRRRAGEEHEGSWWSVRWKIGV